MGPIGPLNRSAKAVQYMNLPMKIWCVGAVMLFISIPSFSEKTLIAKYSDYDPISGIKYISTTYDDGEILLFGRDNNSRSFVRVIIQDNGLMVTTEHGRTSRYIASDDACTMSGRIIHGSSCIHPIVRHFFLNRFTRESVHPVLARIKETLP